MQEEKWLLGNNLIVNILSIVLIFDQLLVCDYRLGREFSLNSEHKFNYDFFY